MSELDLELDNDWSVFYTRRLRRKLLGELSCLRSTPGSNLCLAVVVIVVIQINDREDITIGDIQETSMVQQARNFGRNVLSLK